MALDAYLAEQSRQGLLNGSVLVRQDGETLLDRGYGMADRMHRRPNTPETVFQIASISKQFAAAAILLLQERGALSTQDRIQTWVPGCPAEWETITVHHLLTHTAGIGHWEDFPALSLFEPNTWETLVRIFRDHPLKFPPGVGWAYSSPAYVLLAHIVEQVAGVPYARFLHDQIFHPLGMASTGAGNQAPRQGQQAQGYVDATPVPSFELDTVGIGAGDIWSTTRDMARWDAALAAPGVLSADSLQAMFAPHAAVPDDIAGRAGIHYGYGWFMGEVEGRRMRFHDGGNAGFRSINIQLQDHDAVVILLSNDVPSGLLEISLHLVAAVEGGPDSAPAKGP